MCRQNDKYQEIMRRLNYVLLLLLAAGSLSGQDVYDNLLKAKALRGTGKPDQAIVVLTSALKERNDCRLFNERGEAYISSGNYSQALSDFNSANGLQPGSGEYGLARIYALKGDPATSLYHLEMNMKSLFRKSSKEVMLDPAFRKIENAPEWRKFWKSEWNTDMEERISEVEFYVSAGKVSEASGLLSEFIRNYPDNNEVLYAGALVNLASGKTQDALKAFISLSESDPSSQKYLRALADAQIAASNPSGASLTYSRLIGLEVPDADLYMRRAECYRKTGEMDNAIKDIGKFLSFYPEDKEALSLGGKVEAASGNILKGLEYFNLNLKFHPSDPECYIDRANAYFTTKSWNWAINDFSMALDLDPENSETWMNKGLSLVNIGKTEDACHDFRASLKLGNKRVSEYISRYCIK
jgi:Flp pilus assembly protein TadD